MLTQNVMEKNAQNATKNCLKLLGKMCQNGLVMIFIVPETALLFWIVTTAQTRVLALSCEPTTIYWCFSSTAHIKHVKISVNNEILISHITW